MIDCLPFTLPSLQAAYADGLDPEVVVREVHRRIGVVNDPGIFIHLIEIEMVLAAARALGDYDADKPLFGMPFVIKDNIDRAGLPTTAACPAFSYVAEKDAFVVGKLREAGALLIGKANLDQFATGLVGVRSPFSPPKNAIDPAIVPGGSSSGSAVAVAHGLVSFSLGTDTAGSGRVPAALNNIVGLKPTLGALSASGVVPACRSLDTVSIFALTVEDAYDVFRVACAFDAVDGYARPIDAPVLGAAPPAFHVGVPSEDSIEFFGDEDQSDAFAGAIDRLKDQGAEIRPIDFAPLYELAAMLYQGAWVAERFTVVENLLAEAPDELHPVTRQIVGRAASLSAADTFRDIYRAQDLKRRIEPMLADVDLLAVPSIPTFFTTEDLAADPVEPNSRLGLYTNFVNLLDLAGIALPTGPRADGRPGSVTLLAGRGQDGLIASIARDLQPAGHVLGATGWTLPPKEPRALGITVGEIEVAVCGAHMAGLPLNHELIEKGARFLREDRTSGSYRLFALPGGPPVRPGLVRMADGEGFPIKLEVWALPLSSIGAFLKGIPWPLGLGSIELADGHFAKGFLCEQVGTADATDISSFGGWRRYIQELG